MSSAMPIKHCLAVPRASTANMERVLDPAFLKAISYGVASNTDEECLVSVSMIEEVVLVLAIHGYVSLQEEHNA